MGAEMSIEVMKQALEALETHAAIGVRADKAITILQEAIEEAEKQQPDELTIAYMTGFFNGKKKREWVGLTDEEKHDCYLRIDVWSRCVEMVEAKLKEKNCG
jgi:hypothetical protein